MGEKLVGRGASQKWGLRVRSGAHSIAFAFFHIKIQVPCTKYPTLDIGSEGYILCVRKRSAIHGGAIAR